MLIIFVTARQCRVTPSQDGNPSHERIVAHALSAPAGAGAAAGLLVVVNYCGEGSNGSRFMADLYTVLKVFYIFSGGGRLVRRGQPRARAPALHLPRRSPEDLDALLHPLQLPPAHAPPPPNPHPLSFHDFMEPPLPPPRPPARAPRPPPAPPGPRLAAP